MSDPAGLLLSVRGEARRMVPPDCAVVTAGTSRLTVYRTLGAIE